MLIIFRIRMLGLDRSYLNIRINNSKLYTLVFLNLLNKLHGVQNCIGDAFRGATWVALHNGGGVGWGEVVNGGFGLVSTVLCINIWYFRLDIL